MRQPTTAEVRLDERYALMNTKQRVSAQRGGHLAVLVSNESAAIEFRCRGTPRDGRSRPTTSVSGKCRMNGEHGIAHAEPATRGKRPVRCRPRRIAPAWTALALFLSGAAPSRAGGDPEIDRLLQSPVAKDWVTNGGNLTNQRYSTLKQIDTSNVKQLKGAWMTRLKGSGAAGKYSFEASPLIKDGVMYVVTGNDDVFALNAKTGEVVWKTPLEKWENGYTITSAPLYYDGIVYSGIAGGEFGVRGRLTALDAKSG